VRRVEVYRTLLRADVELDAEVDARVYMSGSAVEAALAWERAHPSAGWTRFALGASSSAALERAGLDHVRPHGVEDGVVEELVQRLARLRPKLELQS
jgi:uroporphyrinogen-III synthase